MWRFVTGLAALSCLVACNQIFDIPQVTQSSRVGGRVRGLWEGADGVALRLQADGVDDLVTASDNGSFRFDALLAPGTAYTVTVMTNPVRHMCIIDRGGNGTVARADITNVSVACTGPPVTIALSGSRGWTFDPTEETQTFVGSVVAQDVAFTINSSAVTSASIDDVAVRLGEQTPRIALPLGTKTMAVSLVASSGLSKTYQLTFNRGASVLEQLTYGKASNTGPGDFFGTSVSLSGDTLAVGAYGEDSGINSNPTDNNAGNSGAVYVFVRNGFSWSQQAYLKASNTDLDDFFGYSLSLFGETLAVGADGEDSAATGVNGSQADNSVSHSGAVYIFIRSGSSWFQQAYLKASNTGLGDTFGGSVSLSGDTLAVGAFRESSAATGINGNQTDNSASQSGAVYIFVRSGASWSQQAYLKASNTGPDDYFGRSVSLSGDTLAVGAYGEDSATTGINGNQADNSASQSGAVYVFVRNGSSWSQQAYLKASNTGAGNHFGGSASLFGDTLAVSAEWEDSAATGVNGNQADNSASQSGAVYLFVRSGASWAQQAYLKASNTGASDRFGASVSLSGNLLAVGAYQEGSATTGVNGNQTDNSASQSGAVYLFVRSGASWAQQAYLKASNTGPGDYFGVSVSLSGDILVVGASGEDSATTGVNGIQADDSADVSGAVYLFH